MTGPTVSFTDRIVVVSGAGGGGIGTTVTRTAAEAGATVIAVSRSQENLDRHVGPLAEDGLKVIPVAADAATAVERGTEPDLIVMALQDGSAEELAGIKRLRAATGARILTAVDFRKNSNNLFVIAIAVGFGMIPMVAPNFWRNLPHELHPLRESGILLSAIVAVALNAFFNGVASADQAREEVSAAAAAAEHV